jgi:hypothetical protein
MKRFAGFVGGMLSALLLSGSVWSAPLFPDAPEGYWAADALKSLASRGLVEGYPDGSFKGDRSATRYEVAMVVARLLARMEGEHASFATRADLEDLRRLTKEYHDELAAFGVRVDVLEETTEELDARVSELERVRFYGSVRSVAVSQHIRGDSALLGTEAFPAIDWSSGRLLTEGSGFTSLGILGLNADLSEDLLFGAEFVGFTSQGDAVVDAYWGVSAPFAANSWTAQGSLTPGAQPDNRQPFTRMLLDNFWVHHKPSDTRLTVGSYFNTHTPGFILKGARNPNIHTPRTLPFYGANVRGTIAGPDSGWKYEAFYSTLPELTTYDTHTFGATLKYQLDKNRGHLAASFARTQNERIADGVLQGPGGPLVPLPTVPFTGPNAPLEPTNVWVDSRTGTPRTRTVVGPQQQSTWGLELDYQILKDSDLRISGEYAHSDYNPDHSLLFFDTSVGGDLWKLGLSAQPIEGLGLGLEYVSVDPTYDPFIVGYSVSPGIPVFLPFGSYYSAYYQLHDFLQYPNNREGFKLTGSYLFNEKNTRVFATYQALDQKRATTFTQAQTPGNIEPLFPVLQTPGATQKGSLDYLNAGISHKWGVGLITEFQYYNYAIGRNAAPVDEVDLAQQAYKFTAEYPINHKWDIRGNLYHLENSGRVGLLNTDFSQTIPGLGVDWNFTDNGTISIDYRLFDLRDKVVGANSYSGDQMMMEMRLDF